MPHPEYHRILPQFRILVCRTDPPKTPTTRAMWITFFKDLNQAGFDTQTGNLTIVTVEGTLDHERISSTFQSLWHADPDRKTLICIWQPHLSLARFSAWLSRTAAQEPYGEVFLTQPLLWMTDEMEAPTLGVPMEQLGKGLSIPSIDPARRKKRVYCYPFRSGGLLVAEKESLQEYAAVMSVAETQPTRRASSATMSAVQPESRDRSADVTAPFRAIDPTKK